MTDVWFNKTDRRWYKFNHGEWSPIGGPPTEPFRCLFGVMATAFGLSSRRCENFTDHESGFCTEHRPKGIMSNDTTAEIQGKLSESLQQFRADVAEAQSACNNIQGVIHRSQQERKSLIAEARGILESLGVVDSIGGAHLIFSERTRLREILDELERLP